MKVGSLFTGYGGLDLAVGGELAWYAEIEPAACKVLAAHYPGVPNLGDITALDWSQVEPIDVLTGGYPCQPFSHAGKRKGKNDERHLWPYVRNDLSIADSSSDGHGQQLHPRAVASLERQAAPDSQERKQPRSKPHSGSTLTTTDPKHHGLNGGAFTRGIGTRQDQGRVQQSEGCDSDTADTDHGHGTSIGSLQGLRRGHAARSDVSEVLNDGNSADTGSHVANARGIGESASAVETRSGLVASVTSCAELGGDSYWQDSTHGIDWGKYAPAIQRWEHAIGRQAPAPTVRRNDKDRLNPVFVEWMMGLPYGWVTDHGLSPAQELKMLGNGVVPQQAHAAITQLLSRAQA